MYLKLKEKNIKINSLILYVTVPLRSLQNTFTYLYAIILKKK